MALIGARQCGKTTFLETLPKTWKLFDLEKQGDYNLITDDPDLFFRLNPNRVAIDEAQLHPPVFNALRVAIDSNRKRKGRFIITGSSSPILLQSISESLAGRVGIIEMSPLCFREITPNKQSPFFLFCVTQKAHSPIPITPSLPCIHSAILVTFYRVPM